MMTHPLIGVPDIIIQEQIRKGGSTGKIGFFGKTRNRGTKQHNGVDLVCVPGVPVYAAHDGYCSRAGEQINSDGKPENRGYGLRVYLKGEGYETRYAHLSVIFVKPNQTVRPGHCIGLAGWSGNADPEDVHLHFEVRVNDAPVDPIDWYVEQAQ